MHHGRWFSNALANLMFLFIFAGTPASAAISYTTINNFQPDNQEAMAPLVGIRPAISMGKSSESVLHIFTDGTTPSTADGAFPAGGLIFGKGGDLFGATQIGGNGACYSGKGSDLGCGTAFSVAP